MYIEQGYKQKLGIWAFFVIPICFIAFMIFNYVVTAMSNMNVEDSMSQLIEMLGNNIVFILLLAPLAAGLFIVLGWAVLVQRQPLNALTTARAEIDWKRVFFAFALWGGLTALFTLIDVYASPGDYVLNFDFPKFVVMAIIAILLVPLQTSFEEYLFRGHLMQGLGLLVKNRWVPLLVTSVLFGLLHIANPEVEKLGYGIMVYYIGTGLFLGIITLMDEGLELALGFHAANNLITALLVTADWTAFQTDSIFKDISNPELGWDVLIPVFVIFPILIYGFSRKYKWTNWQERLFGRVKDREEFLALENEDTSQLQA